MKYFIIDAETTIKNRGEDAIGDMPASPYYKDNKIVLLGERQGGRNWIYATPPICALPHFMATGLKENVLLIGHNISFDLKYIQKHWPITYADMKPNIFIWDTQQVAYLLSGQSWMYPSLDDCCNEIGFELKDEKIKEYWENGVDTELIPMGELKPYLEHDLEATEAVFRYQYDLVSRDKKLFNLVKVKMDDILATVEMENNGMEFDLVEAHSLATRNDFAMILHKSSAEGLVRHHFVKLFDFNPMSNEHVSLALFGGKYSIRECVNVLDTSGNPQSYKTGARKGQIKTKMTDVEYITKGFGLTPPTRLSPDRKGNYSVAEDVLKEFESLPFVHNILRIRELTKENETYYRGYSKLVWPDGKIHGSIGHVGTRTGRNNHSKPNLGNVTREE